MDKRVWLTLGIMALASLAGIVMVFAAGRPQIGPAPSRHPTTVGVRTVSVTNGPRRNTIQRP